MCTNCFVAFWGFLDGDDCELKKKKSQKLILLFMHEIYLGGYWQVMLLLRKVRKKCYWNISIPFLARSWIVLCYVSV